MERNNSMPSLKPHERYALTIREAAQYSNIGETKLREICTMPENAVLLLRVGTKTLIKRKAFEEYLDKIFVL